MNKITGQELANFVRTKEGTPYVYGAKGAEGIFTNKKFNFLVAHYPKVFNSNYINKVKKLGVIDRKVCTDCSGLITWKLGTTMGSAQMYAKAYARLPMKDLNKFAIGTVLWKNGHVGVYVGKDSKGRPLCTEAKGIDYGTVTGVITNPNRWTCGLTFSNINYDIKEKVKDITYKGKNPYSKPNKDLKIGDIGNDVKWLQWELVEAGYGTAFTYENKIYSKVTIDGEFGPITESALKLFQRSSKLVVDGECGKETIKALTLN